MQRVALEIEVETSWFKEARKEGSWRQGWKHQWLQVSVEEEHIREDPEMVEEAAGSEWLWQVQVIGNGHRERLSWSKSSTDIMGRKVH